LGGGEIGFSERKVVLILKDLDHTAVIETRCKGSEKVGEKTGLSLKVK